MEFEEVRYMNEEKTIVFMKLDGVPIIVPVDPENRHYAALISSGVQIAEPIVEG